MKKVCILLITVVGVLSCEDIVGIPDISSSTVQLTAPADNVILAQTTVNLSWESVEDAEEYRIRIATPNFNQALQIVSDTITMATNYSAILMTNTSYEWQVKAINSGFETAYSARTFNIDE